ncbi:MAG: S26 family signal peptidase [Candidatus Omnitrophica bacterium]|nr:S26 family signal peptidase [Candidatus Omnitrophota bacterium]
MQGSKGIKDDVAFVLLRQAVERGQRIELEVANESASMYPLLVADDVVTIARIEPKNMVKGDIVVFRAGDNLCMHRYIRKLRRDKDRVEFLMKGDNTLNVDTPAIMPEDILGRVVAIKKTNLTINMESGFWKISNYLIALVSIVQLTIVMVGKGLIPILWKNKKTAVSLKGRKFLLLSLYSFERLILRVYRILFVGVRHGSKSHKQ